MLGQRGQTPQLTTLRSHLDVLRRRKLVLIATLIVLPGIAVGLAMTHTARYQSTAEVLLNNQNLPQSLTGTSSANGSTPDREAETQARLATVPAVADLVVKAAHLTDRTPAELLTQVAVAARPNADLLVFSVTDPDPATAERLVTIFAREYVKYRSYLDTRTITAALSDVDKELNRLYTAGQEKTALYTSLVEKEQQLQTLKTLQTSNAYVVRAGRPAYKISPRPFRTGVFAGVFALTLGVGLVFLLEALNTRVLGAAEVERQLNLPLLARIPAPPKAVRKMNSLIMQVDPDSPAAEAFRVLRTNLSFHNISIGARTIMVTSAVGGEGKSTTIANLGIALARAGQRVALVELDLRQPVLAGYFGFDRLLGVTDVASGKAQLGSVFVDGGARGETAESGSGSLGLLTAGTSPTVAGEFMASIELRQMLDSLRDQADIVLIDAPPLLLVGDALQLASHVDGIVVVTRLGRVTRQMLNDLRRALRSCDAAKIGFVATGAEREAHYGSGYGYGDGYGYGQQHDRQPDLWSKDS